ncbi:MAG: hypothetical protein ACRD4A_06680, partial [Candidatus Acidiferrales bacterium]
GQGGGYTAPNAPTGAVIDYYLKTEIKPTPEQRMEHHRPVKIVITDERGNSVATDYGPGEAGINRFVWTMQYEGPEPLRYERMPTPNEFFNANRGPRVAPGTYKVSVTANGQTESTNVAVEPDPNLRVDPAIFRTEAEAGVRARNEMSAINEVINRIDGINKELEGFRSAVQGSDDQQEQAKYRPVIARGRELGKKLSAIKDAIYDPNVQHEVSEDDIHQLTDFHGQLNRLVFEVGGAYGEAPNELLRQQMTELFTKADATIKQYNDALRTDVAEYNKAAQSAGAPGVFGGSPIEVKPIK